MLRFPGGMLLDPIAQIEADLNEERLDKFRMKQSLFYPQQSFQRSRKRYDPSIIGHAKPLPLDEYEFLQLVYASYVKSNAFPGAISHQKDTLRTHNRSKEELSTVPNNRIFKFPSGLVEIGEGKYIIPDKSTFCVCDMSEFHLINPVQFCDKFGIIVIDPPWPNRSASRQNVYETVELESLKDYIHINDWAAENCWIFIWITNNPRIRKFVLSALLPLWGAKLHGIWYWLKLDPDRPQILISDLDAAQHKPYEQLLVVKRGNPDDAKLPRFYALFSIPGSHARKPQLKGLLIIAHSH